MIRRSRIQYRPRRHRTPSDVFAYWKWLGTQPCCVCAMKGLSQKSPTEVAHVGVRGIGQKCNGWDVLPFCGVEHHREGKESHHKLGKRFWVVHRLERFEMIRRYQEAYILASGGVELRADLKSFDQEGF